MKPRPFIDYRPSMAKDPLLQRPKVGRAIRSTQDLPDEDFRYGKVYHQDYGVKEIFENYGKQQNGRQHAASTRNIKKCSSPRINYVALNRMAVHDGCTNAKEFRKFQVAHHVYVHPEEKTSELGDIVTRDIHKSMTHGIATPVTSEMKDCLTYKYGREAKENAIKEKELRQRTTTPKVSRRATLASGARPTRASKGHSHKQVEVDDHVKSFKMKRFLAIDHCAIQDHW